MLWLLLALIGYTTLAVVFLLDKFILTKSLDTPVVYTFYSTIFMFAALVAWPFGVELLIGIDWIWALVSGLSFGFAMWAMFIAVQAEEASHVNPFIGAIITIVTFGLAAVFLGESLTTLQILGMFVLAASTLLLACFNERGFTGLNRRYLWGVVAAVLFAISHTTAKYLYDMYPFLTGFVWTRATTGFVGMITLLSPSVWKTLRTSKNRQIDQSTQTHTIAIVVVNKLLSVGGVILIQLAIGLGSVTLVNALVGVQYALMFVLMYLLTKFAPKVLQETFSKSEIIMQTVAILLVILGSAMFVL